MRFLNEIPLGIHIFPWAILVVLNQCSQNYFPTIHGRWMKCLRIYINTHLMVTAELLPFSRVFAKRTRVAYCVSYIYIYTFNYGSHIARVSHFLVVILSNKKYIFLYIYIQTIFCMAHTYIHTHLYNRNGRSSHELAQIFCDYY